MIFFILVQVTSQGNQALTPSVFMYQTPQGIVYAPATGTIQDKAIFSFQQPTQTLAVSHTENAGKYLRDSENIDMVFINIF